MEFGPVPTADAEGAVLAHSLAVPGGRLRKGARLGATEVAALLAGGHVAVTVARLGPGDVGEDEAAARLAAAMRGAGLEARAPFTGRANLHAQGAGVLAVDARAVGAVNAVDPAITVATLPRWQRVAAETMVATVKIIAFGVDGAALERACAAGRGALGLRRPVVARAALIVTTLDGAPGKTRAIVERLERLGIACEASLVPHDVEALASALASSDAPLRLILTASATSDPADVGPSALTQAGGRLVRLGMPVDPGNLLFLGTLGAATVIGLPGCARSPALNGADWVLERVACGVDVSASDIAAMGVGGLLGEIPTRPQPRERKRAPGDAEDATE